MHTFRIPLAAVVVIVVLALSCASSNAASDSGSEGACAYPATDTFSINGTSLTNYDSTSVGQGCDPYLTALYSTVLSKTQVWANSGWTDTNTSGDGVWHQQVLITMPAQAAGTFDLSTGATLEYAIDQTTSCTASASALTLTVTAYGDVGSLITGTYSATLTDSAASGKCPTSLDGNFSVTRAQ